MKVNGPSSLGSTAAARVGSRPAAGGFSVPSEPGGVAEVAHAAPTSGLTAVSSLDALLALQEVAGPLERRRRAVRRAGRILDVLDEIKIALLDGDVTPASLDRLVLAVRQEKSSVEDEALAGVLNEIEARAAVEIAKLEVARGAA
ncbi:flagellar assembly regulator FliX [Phenylobacterium montanum]|uniref:Flagellar assembly protein FliX n=1 Tax=Phenylobacterium montanum TaxID=2823693 RepID=A0A975G231_9CAUL|nr:flagellar assembly protein FliX [Caulobacter sp. S6]QUD89138.1 flagellar assembly protein FliX [Caulobacter sp. S6]